MAIAVRREVRAPIVAVREELTRVVWEKKPDQIPVPVRERRLGLTQGAISHRSFSLGYEYVRNRVSVELSGRLIPSTDETTTVSYRCGIDLRGVTVVAVLWYGIAALQWSSDDMAISVLMVVFGSLSFGWIVLRNAGISMESTPEARYLVERVEHALAEAEARYVASVRSA